MRNGKLARPNDTTGADGKLAIVGGAVAWLALLASMVLFVATLESRHNKEIESLKRANRQLTTSLRHMTAERDDWQRMARR